MKNIYEIRKEKNLFFILDENRGASNQIAPSAKCGIFVNLYYLEDIDVYCDYLGAVSENIDIYIISSNKKLLDVVKEIFKGKTNFNYILKGKNTGRDITAFLIEGQPFYSNYEYVCFIHDKKEHRAQEKKDIELWVKNIWGNLIGRTEAFIWQIIELFENDEHLGCLFAPDPIGDYFCSWYGMGWHGSYGVTKSLADMLGLKCDISDAYPPVGVGTALWFKVSALSKLLEYPWEYDSFDDTKLGNPNYISYGIERIFPFVAQDAGYDSGEVMTLSYARIQNNIIKDETRKMLVAMYEYFPFPTIDSIEKVPEKVSELLVYSKKNESIVLYGAGRIGRFCLSVLRKNGIEPIAFIDNNVSSEKVDALLVKSIAEYTGNKDIGIIITPIRRDAQQEIVSELQNANIDNYHVFWC